MAWSPLQGISPFCWIWLFRHNIFRQNWVKTWGFSALAFLHESLSTLWKLGLFSQSTSEAWLCLFSLWPLRNRKYYLSIFAPPTWRLTHQNLLDKSCPKYFLLLDVDHRAAQCNLYLKLYKMSCNKPGFKSYRVIENWRSRDRAMIILPSSAKASTPIQFGAELPDYLRI